MALLAFGDVFRYEEQAYVYLTQVDSITYAAKVLNPVMTGDLIRQSEKRAKLSSSTLKDASPLYCFVILTTPEYKNCAAHIGSSDKNGGFDDYIEKTGCLSTEDLIALKKEITESNGVPLLLQELAKRT